MTDPESEQPQGIRPEPEQREAQFESAEPEVEPASAETSPTASADQGLSSQRMRAIFGGLVTVAILAVLAIAIFGGDDDSTEPQQTVVDQVATSGGDGNNGNQEVTDGPELGSLSMTGFLCPEASSTDEACMEAGPVEILNATLRLADGETMQLTADMRQGDGSYAWLNIPVGEYVLLADGLLGPDGTPARDVAGATGQVDDGWTIANTDPNQPTVLQVFFIPVEEATAAG